MTGLDKTSKAIYGPIKMFFSCIKHGGQEGYLTVATLPRDYCYNQILRCPTHLPKSVECEDGQCLVRSGHVRRFLNSSYDTHLLK